VSFASFGRSDLSVLLCVVRQCLMPLQFRLLVRQLMPIDPSTTLYLYYSFNCACKDALHRRGNLGLNIERRRLEKSGQGTTNTDNGTPQEFSNMGNGGIQLQIFDRIPTDSADFQQKKLWVRKISIFVLNAQRLGFLSPKFCTFTLKYFD